MIAETEAVVLEPPWLGKEGSDDEPTGSAPGERSQPRAVIHDARGRQPLRLPTITRAALSWHNDLAVCSSPLSFALDDGPCELRLLPGFAPKDLQAGVMLRLCVDRHPCWLWCSDYPLRARWQAYVPLAALADLPGELRNAVSEAALAPVLDMAERALGVPLHIVESPAQPPATSELLIVGFALRDGDRIHVNGALLGVAPLQALLTRALELWPKPPLARWDGLHIPVRCEVGETRLTVAELAQLGLGDVLLLERCHYLRDRSVAVRITPHCAPRARFAAGKWVIEPWREEIKAMEPNKPIIDTDELTVQLTFSLGELSIPLGELRRLQPGYAFELERGLERLVTIHSHGQRIGVGELIQIDGRAGVRIVELSGHLPADG
jgi:type III secretion protein Q